MYRLASKERSDATTVAVGNTRFGEGAFVMIAGPCAIEGRAQIETTARFVRDCGAALVRGGAYKPRTSPYSFQGLGDEGVAMIGRASAMFAVPAVVEAMDAEQLEQLRGRVAMVQIGARNMQNFSLLRACARSGMPVLLKRGGSATLDELLYAAEYVLLEGNPNVVLCERGVRGFDPQTRNLFDLAGAVRLKSLTHLPVIADPSHATGRRELVAPLVLAAAAAGLNGAMVEVHPDPSTARSDAEQALTFEDFEDLMERLRALLRFTPPAADDLTTNPVGTLRHAVARG